MSRTTRRLGRGAGWVYGSRWLERALDFGALVLLARLLAPDDFGLVAIAASFVTIVEGLSDFDVDAALIQSRDEGRSLYDSAWTLSTLRGVVAGLIVALVAPFAGDPRLGPLLYALAVVPLIKGLANPRFVMFERALEFSRPALTELVAKLVSVGAMIAVALAHRSYWALVVGFIGMAITRSLLTYAVRPYLPRPSLERFGDVFAFSGWLSLSRIVTTLSMETDKIIVGRLLGIGDAGLYFMTQRIGVLPTRELVSPLQRILFPSFAELADDRPRLRAAAGESINAQASLGLPAGVGFALIASDVVPLALGPQWTAIVPLLVLLTPFLGLRASLSMTLPCLMALGRTRLLAGVSTVYALVHLPVFIAGTARFGLRGAIGSIVAAGTLYILLNGWMLHRALGITPVEIGRQLIRPALATTAMVAAVIGLTSAPLAGVAELAPWALVSLEIAVGGVVYSATLFALWVAGGRPRGLERRLLELRDR
ncbi:MAG: lipopolysaccharide biosynthesis protein [Gemmatimonadetes bacterium]|nr:lipopolysaccharide biosynthesis protein [Gemmatimonadota bacterium]